MQHNMNADTESELEVLQAIFCKDKEFELKVSGGNETIFTIHVVVEDRKEISALVTFCLSKEYPQHPPEISLQSNFLNREQVEDIRHTLVEESISLQGHPMILELVHICQRTLAEVRHPEGCRKHGDSTFDSLGRDTIGIMLDHMRSQKQYIRTITRWTEELNLKGGLFICGRLIILILQGNSEDIKAHILKHKTHNVDVDSSGKKCKERMLSVLGEMKCTVIQGGFHVKEFSTIEEMENYFKDIQLDEFFSSFIHPHCKKS